MGVVGALGEEEFLRGDGNLDRGAGEQTWLLDRHAQLIEALADLYPVEIATHVLDRVQERLELVPPFSAGGDADLLMAWGEALETECRS